MKITGLEVKRRVWASMGGAVAVIAAWLWWSQGALHAVGTVSRPPEAFVRLTGQGDVVVESLLRERAAYQDATPLFFPTGVNYRPARSSATRAVGESFGEFREVLRYGDSIPRFGADPVTPPETAAELMEKGNEAPFAGLGQLDETGDKLPTRWARVEAKSLSNGRLALVFDIGTAGSPEGERGVMEFIARVERAGLVGPPLLIQSSGVRAVDEFAQNYLVKTARIGARLPPGSYRITVGP
jgi:hypothetical protein